jgi:hypothetical protein
MAISSAQIQLVIAATAADSFGVTTQTAQTAKRDTIVFANGVNATQITAIIDTNVTIAANSTTVTLSNLTDTLDTPFSATRVKGWRLATPSTNVANVTVSGDVAGLWTGIMPPNGTMAAMTGGTGYSISGSNNVTVAGNNGDILAVTLFVS